MSSNNINRILSFSPYAYAKIHWLKNHAQGEIFGFGLTSETNPLLVIDFMLLPQETSVASAETVDDDTIVNYLATMDAMGVSPAQCCRIWIHTHPFASATPSGTDERACSDCFPDSNYHVMIIFADGEYTARLIINQPFSLTIDLDIEIEYDISFPQSDHALWEKELSDNVIIKRTMFKQGKGWKQHAYPSNAMGGYESSIDDCNDPYDDGYIIVD